MGRTHDIEVIVKAAQILQKHENIHFLVIGWGAKEEWLRQAVKNQELINITVLPPQPRDELSISLNACDIALITFVENMRGVSVPSRMYNNLAAGKPLIIAADAGSEGSRLVREENLGWSVTPENAPMLAEAILEAATRPEELAAMGARGRKVVEAQHSEAYVNSKYFSLFQTLGVEQRNGSRPEQV
jgi:glycosyltransferase involved in cell wall biosynthesis